MKHIIVALMLGFLIFSSASYGSFIAPTSAYAEDGGGDGDLTPPEPGDRSLRLEAVGIEW